LNFEAKRCIAIFVLTGIGLAGCGTVPSNFSPSLTDRPVLFSDSTFGLRGSADEAPPIAGKWTSLAPRPKPESTGPIWLAGIRPQILSPQAPLQCVPFARDASGIEIRGDASRWWKLAAGRYTRSRRPQAGSVFVLRGYQSSRRGHVAVVRQILDDRTIVVDHANWGNDGRIYLSAPVRDESPKNDWSRVRVWYTPNDQWGRRIYRAKGFIYPTTTVASSSGTLFGLGSSRH